MKKLIGILICILLIATFLPLTGSTNVGKTRDLPNIGGWSIHIYGPELEIGNITDGICAVIKNIGDADAINVEWKICLEGGIIIPSVLI